MPYPRARWLGEVAAPCIFDGPSLDNPYIVPDPNNPGCWIDTWETGEGEPTIVFADGTSYAPPGGDTTLTPTVVQTVDPGLTNVVPTIQPVTVTPQSIPQQLPTLVSAAPPASSSSDWWLLGLLAAGLYGASKGGGKGRHY